MRTFVRAVTVSALELTPSAAARRRVVSPIGTRRRKLPSAALVAVLVAVALALRVRVTVTAARAGATLPDTVTVLWPVTLAGAASVTAVIGATPPPGGGAATHVPTV